MFTYEVNVLNINVFKTEWKRSSYWQSESKKKYINQSVCLLSVCLSICVCLLILCVSVPRQQIKNRSVFLHVSSSTLWVFESDAASCLPSERNKDTEVKPNTFSVGGHGINYWTKSQADQNAMSHTSQTDKTDFQLQNLSDTLTVMILDHLKVWKT